jgi:hypothetical protein
VVELNRLNCIKGLCFCVLDMLDHSHLFEAPSTRLGSEPLISSEAKTWDKRIIAAVIFFVLVFLALLVLACIAVDHSNNDAIGFHCGRTLGYSVIADMVVCFVCLIVCVIIFYPPFDFMEMSEDMSRSLLGVLFMGSLVLCVVTFIASAQAMNKPECVSAMRSIGEDDYSSVKGFDSPSANTGWALLAVSGYGFGILYIFQTLFFLTAVLLLTTAK